MTSLYTYKYNTGVTKPPDPTNTHYENSGKHRIRPGNDFLCFMVMEFQTLTEQICQTFSDNITSLFYCLNIYSAVVVLPSAQEVRCIITGLKRTVLVVRKSQDAEPVSPAGSHCRVQAFRSPVLHCSVPCTPKHIH